MRIEEAETPRVLESPARIALRGGVLLALLLIAGCDPFYSDSENFRRHREAERAERIAGMRAATQQTARGAAVEGEALRALLSDRTHVSEYEYSPSGRRERYVEYDYFRPDGVLIYRNTAWALDPAGSAGDHWRIEGARLCVKRQAMSPDEACYTIALTAGGSVQYYVSKPGEPTDGLLTREIRNVQQGAPVVESP